MLAPLIGWRRAALTLNRDARGVFVTPVAARNEEGDGHAYQHHRGTDDEDELERAGAYRVYEDPADMLKHIDEVGGRRPANG
mgnify:CR=1 FL=1